MLLFALTAGMSATDAVIQNNILELRTTVLIVLNEEIEVIMKTVKSLEESELLIKRISETIKDEEKEKIFPGMLLGILEASLLGSALTRRWVIRAS